MSERRRPSRLYRNFKKLAKPFWTSEKRQVGIALAGGITLQVLFVTYYNVMINKNTGALMNSLANRSAAEFYQAIWVYVWLGVLCNVVVRTGRYLQYRLKLTWREWMTRRFLQLWFRHQRHYFWNLTQKKTTDNPDQRIAEDIRIFIDSTEQMTLVLFENVLTFVTYGAILWNLSGLTTIPLLGSASLSVPGYLFWLCIGFAVLSNVSAVLTGRKLVSLEYEQQHREADFRFTLVRMREHSEAIALSRGEDSEIDSAMSSFDLIVRNFRAIITKLIHLDIFDDVRGRLRRLVVFLAAAPRVFSGAMTIGAFAQVQAAFDFLEQSTGFVANCFKSLADLQSASRRLADFEEGLTRAEPVQSQAQEGTTSSSEIRTADLDILTPENHQLIERLCFEIREGERVLFKGQSGTGKSTLFRILAGIWPFYQGRIGRPDRKQATFLSQLTYFPQGTLRDAILYPTPPRPISTEEIVLKLNQLGLSKLIERLDAKEDWQKVLSPGEQQRLAVIRAIFQKPRWLFLDEATAALDAKKQSLAYEILVEELKDSAIVSISHSSDLDRFHQKVVHLDATIAKKSS